ncbi:hypothetical protein ES703_29982 [subsurface metagenome]
MSINGKIKSIQPVLIEGRLKVVASVATDTGEVKEAFLPDRELSALLPRAILSGQDKEVPKELLNTLEPIIKKMAAGRKVRMWNYQEKNYVSFLSWRSVRFA